MMKILLVSSSVSNKGHGIIYLTKLAEHLSTELDVKVFVPRDSKLSSPVFKKKENIIKSIVDCSITSREKYIKYGKFGLVIRGVNRLSTGISFFKSLIRHLKDNKYDVVHILDSEYISFIYLITKVSGFKETRFVTTIHASDFNFQSLSLSTIYKSIVAFFLKKVLNKVSYVICHGNWIKERLIVAFPDIKEKILGINYPSNEFEWYDKNLIREKLNISKNDKIVSFLGMIRRDKRIEIAFDTIKLLPPEYKLLVAGSLSDYTEDSIINLIEEKGIKEKVIKHFKYLTISEFDDFFMVGDVFLSTHSDAFPSASGPVSDSRTYGLPVVVNLGGQLEQYVKEEKVGIVSKNSSGEGFSNAILEVFEKIDVYRKDVITTSHSLSWKSFSEQHIKVYKAILKFKNN